MKLTETQHKSIINYLINEGLQYKEFIDEMRDHFIDSIEAKMDEGLNFHQALTATGKAFESEIYRPEFLSFLPKKGLKAMEKKFYDSKKKEINTELKVNLKSSLFTIPNALILCYVGLVYYLFTEYSLKNSSLIHFWIWPFHIVMFYVRKRIKGNLEYSTGVNWFFASKERRVRSVYVNLVFQAFNNKILLFFMYAYLPVTFLLWQDVVSPRMHGYFTLIEILLTLLACVQIVGNLTELNRRISLSNTRENR